MTRFNAILKLSYTALFSSVKDVLDLWYSGCLLCLQLQKGSENTKKTRRLRKEEIKKQLIDSIINNDIAETK